MSKKQRQPTHRCNLCGAPISPARLAALPGATTCIECAKKYPLKVDTRQIELSQASPINRNGFAPSD
jgi:RNA polymerase-binding transcription factor DksA